MGSHSIYIINNLNITITPIIGNITARDVKFAMLCHNHASLFFLWRSHLNIQCNTSLYWSYYLFKYTMKCEPYGPLHLNQKIMERLGLQNVSQV